MVDERVYLAYEVDFNRPSPLVRHHDLSDVPSLGDTVIAYCTDDTNAFGSLATVVKVTTKGSYAVLTLHPNFRTWYMQENDTVHGHV